MLVDLPQIAYNTVGINSISEVQDERANPTDDGRRNRRH